MAENENEATNEDKKYNKQTVLSSKLSGGPHGLGDPNDKSLRKLEEDVLIMNKVREKSRNEKCWNYFKEFLKCEKETGLLVVFRCRAQNSALRECLKTWFQNEELIEECKQEYLWERSEYRRTGIPVKRYKDRIKRFATQQSTAE